MFREWADFLREKTFELIGLDLDDDQIQKLSYYGDLLVEWNNKMNLTNITDPEEVIIKHFIDSLSLNPFIKGKSLVDIGTGAGFPGIPLKIINMPITISLVDSLAKRLDFLNFVIQELALKDIVTIHSRAEDFGRNKIYREEYDIVTARAVARLPVLLEYALPLLKVGGYFLASKGAQVMDEITESEKALRLLGGHLNKVETFSLGSDAENRAVVVIEKKLPTPKQYPRKAGTPAKKPLV